MEKILAYRKALKNSLTAGFITPKEYKKELLFIKQLKTKRKS